MKYMFSFWGYRPSSIQKIKLAIKEFREYLKNQAKENLNTRQVQLLQFLHGDSEERTNLIMHMNINQVAKMTASKDLKDFRCLGLRHSSLVFPSALRPKQKFFTRTMIKETWRYAKDTSHMPKHYIKSQFFLTA